MKKLLSGGLLLMVLVTGTAVQAQNSRYGNNTRTASRPDTTVKPNNNGQGVVQQPAVPPTTVPNPNAGAGAVTFRFDTTNPGGFDAKPEISLRNNYAVDRSYVKDRKPLEYEHIRDDDNLWSEFIWREIDAREKVNQSFMYPGKDNNGEDQRFFSVLLQAIKYDSVTAFSADNDRFTIPLTQGQITTMTAGVNDTVPVPDPVTGAVENVITKKPRFSPDSVYTFRLKEQVIFDKESSRLFTRIIGIAPIAKQVVGGKSQPRTLFWIYYPDLRKTLAKVDVYNPKNFSSRMTWEELFESRFFSSYIIKSSANNPGDKYLNAMIKDPLFRLLEGENIKTRVFNWEQDLWQY
ncbi:type IX secretion system ring subunit PorN/GldN [Sediminibacterium soli]|uniref:type IX secretion system ring protein PorN/GldN n=1 Tax=Sediminibacterium soli TaxID=2698829 RepID=UPI00137AB715|nr:gliding motility protein GldN [Sediminibacterium soli]NCI45433.1 gliding motility protein GldN [Sediminibacterium soli]